MKKIYYVYWYRHPHHCDPFVEGYIGITNNIDRRHNEHRRIAAKRVKNLHFHNVINKYGMDNLTQEVLHTCTKQEALEYELYYRPLPNIGWNMAVGGEDTLGATNKREISLYHKDNPAKVYTFESIKQAAQELGITEARISQAASRKSPHYGFDGWAIIFDETADRFTTKTIQQAISERVTGVKRNKPSHFKGMTNRWSNEDKERIGKQHRGKTLPKEQVAALKEINRHNIRCKPITLVHKDTPEVEHTFHSISEASRQLGIPHPRLKSKATRPLNRYGNDGWKIVKLGAE